MIELEPVVLVVGKERTPDAAHFFNRRYHNPTTQKAKSHLRTMKFVRYLSRGLGA